MESNADGVSDEESQEEDEKLDANGDTGTEDDTMNPSQIESINMSSLPVKRKAVLEEPTNLYVLMMTVG